MCFFYVICYLLIRLHEELRRSIETQMETMRRGEGSGLADLEKEMIDKMQYQLQLISQVSYYF
jgi:hypothetical protein